MNCNEYLKGNEELREDDFKGYGNYQLSLLSAKMVRALINCTYDKQKAARWLAFLQKIPSDFQVCAHIRDIFCIKNDGDLDQKWVNYLLKDDHGEFIFDCFKNSAGRLAQFGGLDEETIKKILEV